MEPYNFSWIITNELCAMSKPRSNDEIQYLINNGIKVLITLSKDFIPPKNNLLNNIIIDVKEFEPPTLEQIKTFITICEETRLKNQIVGVHCRMGRGRTGVMCACYLVKFYDQLPDRAIINVRLMRPGSIETYSQEKIIFNYFDYLRS